MSVEALSWAFQQDVIPAAKKLVLIALANRADEDGYCFPGYKKLAENCSMDRRTVIRHVKDLELDGLIEITSRQREDGADTSNLYRLCLKRGEGVKLPPSSDSLPPRGCQTATPNIRTVYTTHTQPATRDEFLREIDRQRTEGRFKALTESETIIATEAGNCWEYWEAYPDKKPSGNLVAGYIRFLKQSRAIKAAEALAKKASGGSDSADQRAKDAAAQPWQRRIAEKIGAAAARAWIYPLHHDGHRIIAPSKFHKDRILGLYRAEIEAEFFPGIEISVQPKTQETLQ